MRQYEYRLAVIPMLEWADQCNALGAAGWRLMYQESAMRNGDPYYLCFFERECPLVVNESQVVA